MPSNLELQDVYFLRSKKEKKKKLFKKKIPLTQTIYWSAELSFHIIMSFSQQVSALQAKTV